MATKKQYSAPALEKGLDIIELLASQEDGLKVTEITEKLDKSVGELFRMLMVLEQRGYVETIDGSDRYRVSLKLFGLANKLSPVKRLTSVAAPLLKKLAFKIEQSCHVVTFFDGQGHVVAQQDSPSIRNFGVRLGASAPLMNTCSGHVLLSYASKERFEMMLEKIPEYHPKPELKGFKSISETIIQNGYESMRSRQVEGVNDIGFPVFDNSGDVIAALIVPFMEFIDGSHPISFAEAKEYISSTAKDMSEQLGFDASS